MVRRESQKWTEEKGTETKIQPEHGAPAVPGARALHRGGFVLVLGEEWSGRVWPVYILLVALPTLVPLHPRLAPRTPLAYYILTPRSTFTPQICITDHIGAITVTGALWYQNAVRNPVLVEKLHGGCFRARRPLQADSHSHTRSTRRDPFAVAPISVVHGISIPYTFQEVPPHLPPSRCARTPRVPAAPFSSLSALALGAANEVSSERVRLCAFTPRIPARLLSRLKGRPQEQTPEKNSRRNRVVTFIRALRRARPLLDRHGCLDRAQTDITHASGLTTHKCLPIVGASSPAAQRTPVQAGSRILITPLLSLGSCASCLWSRSCACGCVASRSIISPAAPRPQAEFRDTSKFPKVLRGNAATGLVRRALDTEALSLDEVPLAFQYSQVVEQKIHRGRIKSKSSNEGSNTFARAWMLAEKGSPPGGGSGTVRKAYNKGYHFRRCYRKKVGLPERVVIRIRVPERPSFAVKGSQCLCRRLGRSRRKRMALLPGRWELCCLEYLGYCTQNGGEDEPDDPGSWRGKEGRYLSECGERERRQRKWTTASDGVLVAADGNVAALQAWGRERLLWDAGRGTCDLKIGDDVVLLVPGQHWTPPARFGRGRRRAWAGRGRVADEEP
ncbi:hypothetical protein DFH06DRAFT_1124265 [Mycena polygramma]|nr:hypothetical protein DFH06DRAFT_1124265 [Mycena polygramma]